MALSASETPIRTALPGRLGDDDLEPRTDPRIKPALLAAMAAFGLDARAVPAPLTRTAPAEDVIALVGGQDTAFNGLYAALPNDLPEDEHVAVSVTSHVISGPDGNDIELRVFRPDATTGTLPGLIYIHGGGMAILDTFAKVHVRWCTDLAASGMVVVAVDYRNAYSVDGMRPYPAGLNDCAAAIDWVHEHRDELGMGALVIQGESGGANLTLASVLRAKREGRLHQIQGVYACVPYISGGYGWEPARMHAELPSMIENAGLFLDVGAMDLLVWAYDPTGENAENPLAWPYFASDDDLNGLPPHVITVNELDPLRDEGLAYYRKLARAGVPVVGRTNLGLVHGAELIFRQALADDYRFAVADIRRFAGTL